MLVVQTAPAGTETSAAVWLHRQWKRLWLDEAQLSGTGSMTSLDGTASEHNNRGVDAPLGTKTEPSALPFCCCIRVSFTEGWGVMEGGGGSAAWLCWLGRARVVPTAAAAERRSSSQVGKEPEMTKKLNFKFWDQHFLVRAKSIYQTNCDESIMNRLTSSYKEKSIKSTQLGQKILISRRMF